MQTIDEHTFDETLLTKDSKVLDCGCRGFGFANWIKNNIGCYVLAIDADPNVSPPADIEYLNAAVTSSDTAYVKIYTFGNGTANYIETIKDRPSESIDFVVRTYKIQPYWDLIKLDIEGAEGDLLLNMKQPIARQLSVEFHRHCCVFQTEEYVQSIFNHLSQWYNIIGANREKRHGCSLNYWDVLFIQK